MDIVRVEKWETDKDGFAVHSEFEEVFFIRRAGREIRFFDENCEETEPKIPKECFRKLHRVLNNGTDDTIDIDGFAFDIIFHEDNVFPYNAHTHTDYEEALA